MSQYSCIKKRTTRQSVRESAIEEMERMLDIRNDAVNYEEIAQLEAAQLEAVIRESTRLEAARLEAARLDAARLDAARLDAAIRESVRLETARRNAAIQEFVRLEELRLEGERRLADCRNAEIQKALYQNAVIQQKKEIRFASSERTLDYESASDSDDSNSDL